MVFNRKMVMLAIIAGVTLGSNATVINTVGELKELRKSEVALEAASMSVAQAIAILKSMNNTTPELLTLVQENFGSHPFRNLKGSKGISIGLLSTHRAGPDANADYSPGLKNAMIRLNEMMLETIMTMDAADLECRQFSRTQQSYITELEDDSQYYSRLVTTGNAGVLNARSQKASYYDNIQNVKGELEDHNGACVLEMAELNRQLGIAKSDAQVMDKILNMTQCNDVAYEKAEKVALLQCVDKRTGRRYTKMRANDPALKKELAKLQHPTSLKAISSAMVTDAPQTHVVSLLGRRLRRVDPSSGPPPVPETPAGGGGTDNFQYGQVVMNATADPNLEQGSEECSLSNSSKCPELRERFVNIAGGVEDAIEELTTMLENKQLRCSQIRVDLEAELDHYGYWFKEWETRLATGVQQLGESRTAFKGKSQELMNARKLYDEKMASCLKNWGDSKSELCALTKIRGELATMSAWDKEITDCSVSEWDVPSCGVTCGGGTQQLTRITEMQPGAGAEAWEKGHECPVLTAVQSCNEFRCPVDCELSVWAEWSRCTVTCDGGVQERLRSVTAHPTPNGNPCEPTLETVVCNSGPCDKDCELSEWTEWSNSCTKMCGGGQSTRIRSLVKTQIGDGTCATFYESSRFQAKPCNTQSCAYHSTMGRCLAKIDVLLLIDGSGSLGTTGWDAIKTATMRIANAVVGGASLGALLFSGPPDTCQRKRCVGQDLGANCKAAGWTQNSVVTPEECGMDWVSHLTTDYKTVAEGIDKMNWPAQVSLHSIALKSAEIELLNGRRGVPKVVILLTDGEPYSKAHTTMNAETLKAAGARVIMVPIGQDAATNEMFREWVSYPVKDNLVPVEDFDTLIRDNSTLNHAMTNFCTQFVA